MSRELDELRKQQEGQTLEKGEQAERDAKRIKELEEKLKKALAEYLKFNDNYCFII